MIVHADCSQEGQPANVVRIPSPKNASEEFKFMFNGVYDSESTQETLFTNEGVTVVARSVSCEMLKILDSCASSKSAIQWP